MTQYSFSHDHLLKFLGAITASGKKLYAPQRKGEKVFFAPVMDVNAVVFDYIQTTESPKELLLPKYQKLISFEYQGAELHVNDHAKMPSPEHVLFGSRPCDASALQRLADFFARDISDAFVAQQQNALTVISMSCTKADADCFCTSTGTSPGDTTGSDILLTPIEDGRYYVECLSEKGSALIAEHKELFESECGCRQTKILGEVRQSIFTRRDHAKACRGIR